MNNNDNILHRNAVHNLTIKMMIQVAFIPILTNDYYYMTKYYRFMPASIFDALERSFCNGETVANVPEADFLKMITEIKLSDGSQDN